MINLRNSPFLWFAVLLLISYQPGTYTDIGTPGWTIPVPVILAAACAIAGVQKYLPGKAGWSTIAVSMMVLFAGFTRQASHLSRIFHDELLATPIRMEGRVRVMEVLKRKVSAATLRCEVIDLRMADSTQAAEMKDAFILVQLRDPPLQPLFPGDTLSGVGWVAAMAAPSNPHAFDLRPHYRSMGIRHRMNCKSEEIRLEPGQTFSFRRTTSIWQYSLSAIVHAHTGLEVAQLTNALVWGDRSDMEQDVIDAFADSGAMHVLSVSGMHVAIIYSMLFLILGPPGSGTLVRRLSRLAMYITGIVLYMALTGGSAAVVRAGWMIILYLAGKAMGWNTQVWNLMGFAAFIMLWCNPLIWHNIGFQLSFLAMAGLLLYTKPIGRALSFKFTLMQRIWDVCAVSIAAQVFILPVLLSRFHQFPLTFIASSLVAMPAGYVIIFGALGNVVVSALGLNWFWPLLDKTGEYFIDCMKWMAQLNPEMHFAMPSAAGWMLTVTILLFSSGLIYHWTLGKKMAYATGAMVMVLLLLHRAQQWSKDEVIVYHSYQGILIDIIRRGHCLSIRDTSINSSTEDFATNGYRAYRDIISKTAVNSPARLTSCDVEFKHGLLRMSNHTWLLFNDTVRLEDLPSDIDVIVVDHIQNVWNARDHICLIHPGLVILPAHLPSRTRSILIRFFNQQDLTYHDVSQKGYYIQSL